jgi:hypothetical protein
MVVCLIMCDIGTSEMRRPKPELGCRADDKAWSVEIENH